MPSDNNNPAQEQQHPDLVPGDGLVHSHQLPQQSDQDYRELERQYHRSAQYAAMVSQYPQLRHWINACRRSPLVGDAPEQAKHHTPKGIVLQWDRSHGEG